MSNTYTWTISSLEGYETFQNNTNVVANVDWICTGTNGTNTAKICGTTPIIYNSSNSFVPFASLTQAQIISWVQSVLGANKVSDIQSELDLIIQNEFAPAMINFTIPTSWTYWEYIKW